MDPGNDPRAEAAFLSAALRRGLQRRKQLGQRFSTPSAALPESPQEATPEATTEALSQRSSAMPPGSPPSMPAPPRAQLNADEVRQRAAAVQILAQSAPDLPTLEAQVAGCTACELCSSRTKTVFADGQGIRPVLFLGDAPSEQEDLSGTPFEGPAGKLLTDIIEKGMGIGRPEVSIANLVKCRSALHRDPSPAEKAICAGWLQRQIELLNPQVIVPLGPHASQHILGDQAPMGAMRATVHEREGRKIVPTYHPRYLLQNPAAKKDCWADIQLVMAELGIPRPSK